jgi:hypothetical protein
MSASNLTLVYTGISFDDLHLWNTSGSVGCLACCLSQSHLVHEPCNLVPGTIGSMISLPAFLSLCYRCSSSIYQIECSCAGGWCWWLVLVVDIRLKQPFCHKWKIIIIWRLRSHLPLIFLSCCHVLRMLVHHQHGRQSYRSCGAMIDAMVSHGGTIMSGDFYSEIRLYLISRNQ